MSDSQKNRQYLVFVLLLAVSSSLAILGYREVHRDQILSLKGGLPLSKPPSFTDLPQPENKHHQERGLGPAETPPVQPTPKAAKNPAGHDVKKAAPISDNAGRADRIMPSEQQPVTKDDDAARLQHAEILMIRKEYGQAVAIYRKYLERHGNDLKVRLKLAEILSWQKDYDASLAEYERILTVRPDDRQVRRKYSDVLLWSGKVDEAAKELRKTLE